MIQESAKATRRAPELVEYRYNRPPKGGAPRLQQLSEEVGRIANILATLSEENKVIEVEPRGSGRKIEAGQIRAIIRARRMRDHFFKSDLFADPAWDMLLDLMAARLEKQRVAVSSLCIAAAVPPTTALRWIKSLSDQGLFVRVADAEDGRRVFIELSDWAATALDAYLKTAIRVSPIGV
jgi:DNA-binding MarR family transcriptional regulator